MKQIALLLAAVLALSACAAPAGQGAEATQVAQATTLADGFASQYELGLRFLGEGNYQEAILAFTAAIEIDPRRPEAWVGRAQAYVGDGQLEPAAADYEAAIELDGTVAEYYLGLADVYISLEWLDKAIELLKRAVELFTDVPELAQRLEEAQVVAGLPRPREGYPKTERYDFEEQGDFPEAYHISDYNEYGNITKRTFYDIHDVALHCLDYYYDDLQLLLQMNYTDFRTEGRGTSRAETYYDASGRAVEEIRWWYDGGIQTDTYEYSEGTEVIVTLSAIELASEDGNVMPAYKIVHVYQMKSSENTVMWSGTSRSTDGLREYTLREYTSDHQTFETAYNPDGSIRD